MGNMPRWFQSELYHSKMVGKYADKQIGAMWSEPYYIRMMDPIPDQHIWVLKVAKDSYRFSLKAEELKAAAVLHEVEIIKRKLPENDHLRP